MDKKQLRKMREQCEKLHKDDKPYKKAANKEFFLYLLAVITIAMCIRTFVFEPVRCIGPSMHPTLQDGEGMFVEKLTYTFTEPKRGDIIICRYPYYVVKCVKRVIAVPGDTVGIADGKIYLNGSELDESAYWNDYIVGDMRTVTVPEDSLFVVGDNRNESGDSRHVGFIPYAQVKGKVHAVMTPFAAARWVS